MRVALTGTPGVGKSTVAAMARAAGWRVVGLGEWAHEVGAVAGRDDQDDADVLDMDALVDRFPADDGSNVVYDGHLAHLLPVDYVWVIRCDPDILRGRLQSRGYKPSKVLENLEAEALDLILQEALDQESLVIQVDGTRRTPAAIFTTFVEASSGSMKDHNLEVVDWSLRLPIR